MYPYADQFDPLRSNTDEVGIGRMSAVGIFPDGASPYGALDMSGNVWEWVNSTYAGYPYDGNDGRDSLNETSLRVLRGGSFNYNAYFATVSSRDYYILYRRHDDCGLRLVVSAPLPV
jgi:formylglycine-generating enzyme required for sulfatase activity